MFQRRESEEEPSGAFGMEFERSGSIAAASVNAGGNNNGIFYGTDSGLQAFVRDGQAAPGGGGGVFAGYGPVVATNNAGQLAFYGNLSGAAFGVNQGIFRATVGGGTTQIVRQMSIVPGGGTFDGFSPLTLINSSNQVAFSGIFSAAPDQATTGVFRYDSNGNGVAIAHAGKRAGGGTLGNSFTGDTR
jgi:hypothetical protein